MAEKRGGKGKSSTPAKSRGKKKAPARPQKSTKGKTRAAKGGAKRPARKKRAKTSSGQAERSKADAHAAANERANVDPLQELVEERESRLAYEDVDAWAKELAKEPRKGVRASVEWDIEALLAKPHPMELAYDHLPPRRERLWRLTHVLAGWCMHHKGPNVDPLPLLEFTALRRQVEGAPDTEKTAELGPALRAAYRRAKEATSLLRVYVAVKTGKPIEGASGAHTTARLKTHEAQWVAGYTRHDTFCRHLSERKIRGMWRPFPKARVVEVDLSVYGESVDWVFAKRPSPAPAQGKAGKRSN